MKKMIVLTVAIMVVLSGAIAFAEKAPQKVVDAANSKFAAYGTEADIVKAVKAQNAQRKSLASIKEQDAKWKNTAGVVDYMKALMENECGKFLKGIQNSDASIAEIFVMDNQGANVCMTDKTSDYWQGDEGKFKNSYNGGKGAVFVDDVEFDDSTQAYISQVSVPVVDGGKVIGAITFGIDIDALN
jgi:hypothetical protein